MLHIMTTVPPPSGADVTEPITNAIVSVVSALFALATPLFTSLGFIVVLVYCFKLMFSKRR